MLHPYTQYTLLLLYDYCIISLFAEAALHIGQVPMLVYYKNDRIYGNCSKLYIRSYKIINFEVLQPAKDCENEIETYRKCRPFHCIWEFP